MWNATLGLVRNSDGHYINVIMTAQFFSCTETLSSGDLATLVNELHEVRADWYELGVQLRMETHDLDVFRLENQNDTKKCLRQMLSVWLLQEFPSPPSWERVVDALSSPAINKKGISKRLKHIYYNPSPEGNMFCIYQCHMSHFHFTECCKKPNDALKAKILNLEKSFTRLRLNVYKLIRSEPVDVFVAGLLAMDVNGQEHHVPFLKEITKGKDSVFDIWSELSPYLNFLNYEILQHILFNFSDDSVQKDMDEYASMMEDFFQETRLCKFLECWPVRGKAPPAEELSNFVVKHKKDWDTCTLHDLDILEKSLARKLFLPTFAVILRDASPGCVSVTFSVPTSLVPQLQSAVRETQLREFVEMEIESITVDGVVCYEALLLQYTTLLKQLYTSRSPLQPLSDSKPNPLLPFRLAKIEKQTLSSSSDMDRFTRESLRGDMDDVIHKKTAMELSGLEMMGDSSRPQVVLIEGAPGVGKTTFAWHQCRHWAEGRLLQDYSIVLLLPLRDNNIRQISSLPGLFLHSRGKVREEVSRRVAESGGKGCLIWLEAWDELPDHLRSSDSFFTQLIRGLQLPAATIFITSRPWATRGLLETVGDRMSQHTELLSLAKEEVENVTRALIVAIHSQTSSDSGFDFLQFIESNPVICAAMYTPVSAAIVEQVFKSAPHSPPTTVTQLYSAFVLMRLEQHLSEHPKYSDMNIKVRTLADLPERVLEDMQQLCGLAYEGVSQQKIVFSCLPEGVSTLGLLQTVTEVYEEEEGRVSYNFLHYTVQEYLAALHLSHLQPHQLISITDTNCLRLVDTGYGTSYYEATQFKTTFQFLAGITELEQFPVAYLSDLLEKDAATMYRWLYESQNQSLLTSVLGSGERWLRLSYSATATDYFASGYCLAHSNCRWRIHLTFVDDVTMEFLTRGCNYQLPMTGISSHLVSANLSYWSISAEVVGHFMCMPNSLLQHIQHLNLSGTNLDRRGCELLAEGVQRMPYLEKLYLSGNEGIGCGGVVQLLSSLHNSRLRELVMTKTGISDPDFDCLARYIHSTKCLEELSIGRNEISVESIDSLCRALSANSSMRMVNMNNCRLTTSHCVCLGQLLRHPIHCQIEKLYLIECGLTSDGVGKVVSGLSDNHSLRELILIENQIGSEGAVAVATMLKTNSSLETLHLAWCGIGSSGGVELGAALERNKTLRSVNLSGNELGEDGVRGLSAGLENNSSLEKLGLDGDESLGEEGVIFLLKTVEENNTGLKKLRLPVEFKRDLSRELQSRCEVVWD